MADRSCWKEYELVEKSAKWPNCGRSERGRALELSSYLWGELFVGPKATAWFSKDDDGTCSAPGLVVKKISAGGMVVSGARAGVGTSGAGDGGGPIASPGLRSLNVEAPGWSWSKWNCGCLGAGVAIEDGERDDRCPRALFAFALRSCSSSRHWISIPFWKCCLILARCSWLSEGRRPLCESLRMLLIVKSRMRSHCLGSSPPSSTTYC